MLRDVRQVGQWLVLVRRRVPPWVPETVIPIKVAEHWAQTILNGLIVKIVPDCIVAQSPAEIQAMFESIKTIVPVAGPG